MNLNLAGNFNQFKMPNRWSMIAIFPAYIGHHHFQFDQLISNHHASTITNHHASTICHLATQTTGCQLKMLKSTNDHHVSCHLVIVIARRTSPTNARPHHQTDTLGSHQTATYFQQLEAAVEDVQLPGNHRGYDSHSIIL